MGLEQLSNVAQDSVTLFRFFGNVSSLQRGVPLVCAATSNRKCLEHSGPMPSPDPNWRSKLRATLRKGPGTVLFGTARAQRLVQSKDSFQNISALASAATTVCCPERWL